MKSSADLLKRYNRPGPRYTSYPTALEFDGAFGPDQYAERLAAMGPGQCLSLYIHLPFCESRCDFCGCHVIATRHREVGARYLDYLVKEMDAVVARLPSPPSVIQYHWGGGTPTYFSPEQLSGLHRAVEGRFGILPDAERGIELDPRVTSRDHIDTLAELGFNRISMGVQDFDPRVQEAIGRGQDEETTRGLYDYCRQRGFGAVNIDLVYGLPGQTADSFARTLASVLLMRPERVALYSYAHVPWVRGNQQRIDEALLPSPAAKLELMRQAVRAFGASGYESIGMDHFALPTDELAKARADRRLHRNFMGYTVHRAPNMIGLGISAIGQVMGAYAQNAKKLSAYYTALDAGRLPVERGYALTRDDRIRRHVITALMCNLYVDTTEIQRAYDIRFGEYFAAELEELGGDLAADGLVEIKPTAIEVTDRGSLFVRNVCMVFDRYLKAKALGGPAFSRTV